MTGSSAEGFRSSMETGLKGRSPQDLRRGRSARGRFRRDVDAFTMPVEDIELEGFYVREFFDEDAFRRLCASIRENGGVDQPLDIRQKGQGREARYILVAGLRRLRALKEVGIEEVLVRNRGEISEREALAIQGRENEARQDPDTVDSARLYARMKDGGYKQREIAEMFGKTEGYASYMVRAGYAILEMSEAERDLLHTSPDIKNSTLQKVVGQAETTADRKRLLLAIARGETSLEGEGDAGGEGEEPGETEEREDVGAAGPEGPFYRKVHADGGRTFRVRWRPRDLRGNPGRFLRRFMEQVREEMDAIQEACRAMAEQEALDEEERAERMEEIDREIEAAGESLEQIRQRLEGAGYGRGRRTAAGDGS